MLRKNTIWLTIYKEWRNSAKKTTISTQEPEFYHLSTTNTDAKRQAMVFLYKNRSVLHKVKELY